MVPRRKFDKKFIGFINSYLVDTKAKGAKKSSFPVYDNPPPCPPKDDADAVEWAIYYLKVRAMDTRELTRNKRKILKQSIAVLSIQEVESILEMLREGSFMKFYNDTKEKAGKYFP
jgi:hypothetical protein